MNNGADLDSKINALPADLKDLVWLAAIPHWFDAGLLAVLDSPHVAPARETLFTRLTSLDIVEEVPGRGWRVQPDVRAHVLNDWWFSQIERYRLMAQRAAELFKQRGGDENDIESVYHWMVVYSYDTEMVAERWLEVGDRLKANGNFNQVYQLIQASLEHLAGGRLTQGMMDLVIAWGHGCGGALERRARNIRNEDLEAAAHDFDFACSFYRLLNDPWKEEITRLRQADCLVDARNYDEAIYLAQTALETFREYNDPVGIARSYAVLGDASSGLGKYQDAQDQYQRGLESLPGSYRCHVGLTNLYQTQGKNDEVVRILTSMLKIFPRDAWANAHRGEAHRLMAHYDEALGDFNTAIRLSPNYGWAIASRGQTYRLMRRYAEALADYNQANDLMPNSQWLLGERGETHRLMGNHDQAIADFNRSLELNPDDVWVLGSRGQALRAVRKLEEALTDFNRALQMKPDTGWIIGERGETFRLMSRFEEAVSDFSRAIEITPDSSWLLGSRGQAYQGLSRYDEALADFNRSLELRADVVWVLGARGETHRLKGNYDQAITDFTRAIELDPGYAWGIASRAQAYRALYKYEEALADCNRALEINPRLTWAISERGYILWLTAQYREALLNFERVLELEPQNDWAFARRGQTKVELGLFVDGLADIEKSLKINPRNEWVIPARGFAYLCVGQNENALADFNTALQNASDNDWRHFQRGLAHRRLGRMNLAENDFKNAVQIIEGKLKNSYTHGNQLYLGLYLLLSGNIIRSEQEYNIAIEKKPSAHLIRDMAYVLNNMLYLFPDDRILRSWRDRFAELAKIENFWLRSGTGGSD